MWNKTNFSGRGRDNWWLCPLHLYYAVPISDVFRSFLSQLYCPTDCCWLVHTVQKLGQQYFVNKFKHFVVDFGKQLF